MLELLTISEVASRLKINVNLVYKLIKAGHIKALKLGCLKVTSIEFERFLVEANGKDFSDLNNVTDYVSV
ncbi:helix-turn-helix domain-containing protein [Clostridium hominis]|uniref:helix-turn-helix domain-containing protein n=1 Tax=Clostridium hominis TaxID=2763036 RepID=UPI00345062E1